MECTKARRRRGGRDVEAQEAERDVEAAAVAGGDGMHGPGCSLPRARQADRRRVGSFYTWRALPLCPQAAGGSCPELCWPSIGRTSPRPSARRKAYTHLRRTRPSSRRREEDRGG